MKRVLIRSLSMMLTLVLMLGFVSGAGMPVFANEEKPASGNEEVRTVPGSEGPVLIPEDEKPEELPGSEEPELVREEEETEEFPESEEPEEVPEEEKPEAEPAPKASISISRLDMYIDEPVLGGTPDTTLTVVPVPAGTMTQTEYTVGWLESTDGTSYNAHPMSTPTFENGKYYILDWPRDPYLGHSETEGYAITVNTVQTLNGNSISWTAEYLYWFDPFPADVYNVYLTIDFPKVGVRPDTTFSVTADPDDALTVHELGATWYESATGNASDVVPMTTSKFRPGIYYFVDWPRDPYISEIFAPGYSLASGATIQLYEVILDQSAPFAYRYDRMSNPITKMAFAIDEPLLGAVPDTTLEIAPTPSEGLLQNIFNVEWLESTDGSDYSSFVPMTTETFEAGKYYILCWPQNPGIMDVLAPGYFPAENTKLNCNGKSFSQYDWYIRIFDPLEEGTLKVNASMDSKGITLKWNSVSGAAKYRITDLKKNKALGTVTDLAYLDKRSLKMGTTYKYRVTALKSNGKEIKSVDISVKYNPFMDVSTKDASFQYIAWAYNNSVVKGTSATTFSPENSTTRMNFVMILWKMHGSPTVKGKNPFSDVSGTKSVNAVKWAVKKEIVKGTSATTFSPDDPLSRMNIIMILWKMAGSPNVSGSIPFTDVSGTKAVKAVKWAYKKGIIAGDDETHFDPDGECSRALLVEVLCKYNELYPIL